MDEVTESSDTSSSSDTLSAPPSGGVAASERTRAAAPQGNTRIGRHFGRYFAIYLVALAGFLLRADLILYVRPMCIDPSQARVSNCLPYTGDSVYHEIQATHLAEGNGYVNSRAWVDHVVIVEGAGDPPVYATWLALLNKVGITTFKGHRLADAAVGSIGIVLIGLLAARLRGLLAGQVAAIIAALHPMLWINDLKLLPETIYAPMVAGFLILAYRLWEQPTTRRAVHVGLICGLMALTRGEGFMIVGLLALPLALGRRPIGGPAGGPAGGPVGGLSRAARLRLAAIAVATSAAIMTPWIAYNLSRFPEPVFLTSGTGNVLRAGSCESTFNTSALGYYSFRCLEGVTTEIDESLRDQAMRKAALDFLSDHRSEIPKVVLARIGRIWDVYDPAGNIRLNTQFEQRNENDSRLGLFVYLGLWPFAVMGGLSLFRRHITLAPIVAIATAITITAAISFGVTRYRVPADVAQIALAGVGVSSIADALSARRRARARAASRTPADTPAPEIA